MSWEIHLTILKSKVNNVSVLFIPIKFLFPKTKQQNKMASCEANKERAKYNYGFTTFSIYYSITSQNGFIQKTQHIIYCQLTFLNTIVQRHGIDYATCLFQINAYLSQYQIVSEVCKLKILCCPFSHKNIKISKIVSGMLVFCWCLFVIFCNISNK